MLCLYNTLAKEKQEFKPIKNGSVSMYNCGPTVYNFAHIGNMRSYVFADILRRTLEIEGYKVHQVINITDVGHLTDDASFGKDKVEEKARKEGKNAKEISEFYTKAFFDDLKKLNIETKGTIFPKATEHIQEQIALIKKLEGKGYTYKTSDGIYFDTSKFKNYGKLGNTNITGIKAGARVSINSEKRNTTDFALWKFSIPHEKRQQEWQSPWGVGFPGWHIECSAMSEKYLGETFDIHTGGIDHIPVHHNNEIAQSEGANEKPLAHYWLHNDFVNVLSGEKMSKSSDNFIKISSLEEKEFSPLDYRYLLLTAHYRTQMNFTWEALEASKKGNEKILKAFLKLKEYGKVDENYFIEFKKHLENDLDTPGAIALVWKLLKDETVSDPDKKSTLEKFDTVLGLNLEKRAKEKSSTKKKQKIPKNILILVSERENARTKNDWKKSDELREKIKELGYDIKDTKTGPEVFKI